MSNFKYLLVDCWIYSIMKSETYCSIFICSIIYQYSHESFNIPNDGIYNLLFNTWYLEYWNSSNYYSTIPNYKSKHYKTTLVHYLPTYSLFHLNL